MNGQDFGFGKCAVEGLGFKVVSNWIASGLHTALTSKKNGLTQAKFDVVQLHSGLHVHCHVQELYVSRVVWHPKS